MYALVSIREGIIASASHSIISIMFPKLTCTFHIITFDMCFLSLMHKASVRDAASQHPDVFVYAFEMMQ